MLTDWALRLRSLFRRGGVEHELDDELRFHLAQQVSSLIRQGLTPDEAIRRAQRATIKRGERKRLDSGAGHARESMGFQAFDRRR